MIRLVGIKFVDGNMVELDIADKTAEAYAILDVSKHEDMLVAYRPTLPEAQRSAERYRKLKVHHAQYTRHRNPHSTRPDIPSA